MAKKEFVAPYFNFIWSFAICGWGIRRRPAQRCSNRVSVWSAPGCGAPHSFLSSEHGQRRAERPGRSKLTQTHSCSSVAAITTIWSKPCEKVRTSLSHTFPIWVLNNVHKCQITTFHYVETGRKHTAGRVTHTWIPLYLPRSLFCHMPKD